MNYNITDWLPTTKKEVTLRGWDELDVILFTGDAYVDHPSFGAAVIGRILEQQGLKVAIVPQPNWRDDLRDFKKLGTPRLFFGVTSGAMDSMVNHYTANKRLRSNDAYTPGGRAGQRPDYSTIVYSNILKDLYPDTPVIIGGIEASLRRFTHYDYWSDKLRPTILEESKADLLVYGMGEKPILDIVHLLEKGVSVNKLDNITQTAFLSSNDNIKNNDNDIELHSHKVCLNDKLKFAENFKHIEEESNKVNAKRFFQKVGDKLLVVNPPNSLMTEKEIDAVYDLPFTRLPHPKYIKKESIPAYEMIRHSVNIHRGCFGGCSFCTISAHQGKFIVSRSKRSIIEEVKKVTEMPDFKGYLSDVGGPSANMYKMQGKNLDICNKCKRPSCIDPSVCSNLNTSHKDLISLYKDVRKQPKIKKAFIGSGVRYDLFLHDKEKDSSHSEYPNELIQHHVSGRLKVAPEHSSDDVLQIMRKPSFSMFITFTKLFDRVNKKFNLKQQLIPYFISSHPGSESTDMADLAIKTKDLNFQLEQVQDFTPTPMTLATVMYYSGYDPYTLKKVYTAKTKDEKLEQRDFFFWYKREFRGKITSTLTRAGRKDLLDKLFSSNKR